MKLISVVVVVDSLVDLQEILSKDFTSRRGFVSTHTALAFYFSSSRQYLRCWITIWTSCFRRTNRVQWINYSLVNHLFLSTSVWCNFMNSRSTEYYIFKLMFRYMAKTEISGQKIVTFTASHWFLITGSLKTHCHHCYVCLWVANKAEETHFVQVRILTGVTVHLAPDILTSGVGSTYSDAHEESGLWNRRTYILHSSGYWWHTGYTHFDNLFRANLSLITKHNTLTDYLIAAI